jgi:hypothetical protein
LFEPDDVPWIRCLPIRDRRNYFVALHELGRVAVAPAYRLPFDGMVYQGRGRWRTNHESPRGGSSARVMLCMETSSLG